MKQKIQIIILVFSSFFLIIFPSYSHEINIEEIETIIKNYLIKNPKIIKSTLDDYKKTAEINKKNNAIKLLKDIENPGIYNENSDITIYEFFDYNCGYCKSVVKTIMDVMSEDKKVNLVFVELPILSQNSYIAATAALASEKQGLYNDYHLSLMSVKGRINEDVIFKIAKKTGLNINQLKIDMKNPEIENKLTKNREIAKLLNLNGTPAFIVGDIIYPGALQKSDLKQIIKSFREK
jgi:protein-disulfide isomerase